MQYRLTAVSTWNSRTDKLPDHVYKLQMNDFHISSHKSEHGYVEYNLDIQTIEELRKVSTILECPIIVDADKLEIYDHYRE